MAIVPRPRPTHLDFPLRDQTADGVGTFQFPRLWSCTSPATVCDALAALATAAANSGGSVPTIPSLGVEARGASQLLIRENTIPANVSVVFAVRIRRTTAETTTASASVTIFTREGAVLKVSVNPGSGIVNSGTDIRLRARPPACQPGHQRRRTRGRWFRQYVQPLKSNLASIDGANLLIKSTALVPGQLYTRRRISRRLSEPVLPFANVPPVGGSFDITPSEVRRFPHSPKSMDGAGTPVVYTFVYLDPSTGAETPIVDKRDSGTMSDVTLPAGSAAKNHSPVVKAYVFDSLGASPMYSARSSFAIQRRRRVRVCQFCSQRSKFVAHHVVGHG